jgi:hypothetical protein
METAGDKHGAEAKDDRGRATCAGARNHGTVEKPPASAAGSGRLARGQLDGDSTCRALGQLQASTNAHPLLTFCRTGGPRVPCPRGLQET